MTAFMVAKSDGENYGQLQVFTMPRSNLPNGPALVQGEIQSAEEVSRQESLLGEGGSRVTYGSLAAIPIDNGLVWVRPFYVTSTQTDLPSLRFVIVNFEGTVSIKPTLIEALADVFDQDLPTGEEPPPDPGEEPEPEPEGTVDEQVAALLTEASDLFDQADQALRDGDLAGFEELSDEARDLVEQAETLIAESPRHRGADRRPPPPSRPRPSGQPRCQAVAAHSPGSPSRSIGVVSSESLRSMIVSARVRARRCRRSSATTAGMRTARSSMRACSPTATCVSSADTRAEWRRTSSRSSWVGRSRSRSSEASSSSRCSMRASRSSSCCEWMARATSARSVRRAGTAAGCAARRGRRRNRIGSDGSCRRRRCPRTLAAGCRCLQHRRYSRTSTKRSPRGGAVR